MAGIVLFVLLSIGISGCGGPGFDFTGTWRGERQVENAPPHIAGAIGKVELEMMPNGRFRLTHLSLPTEGRYRIEDGVALLTVEQALGKPVIPGSPESQLHQEIRLVPQDDGSLLMSDPGEFGLGPVRLTR
jgi:hypothetical protein